jgi:broad specificity phosphatase PhoE
MAGRAVRMILLRHGQVASHQGDLPLTDEGRRLAEHAGTALRRAGTDSIAMFAGPAQRARETADGFAAGFATAGPPARVVSSRVSPALRNPDLWLAGERVDMVSTPAAFCDQVGGLTQRECLEIPFYAGFLSAPDRIGWWLHHKHPPGDDATAVAARVAAFAVSLLDVPGRFPPVVVGVTHSPVLRAIALAFRHEDPGEPGYLTGYSVLAAESGAVSVEISTGPS